MRARAAAPTPINVQPTSSNPSTPPTQPSPSPQALARLRAVETLARPGARTRTGGGALCDYRAPCRPSGPSPAHPSARASAFEISHRRHRSHLPNSTVWLE
ncbi:hypothetical protein V499_01549 [Pseudogymnoascus sp. VKM F-103]|nr:hypothetical protein V499_01549 [Pseudogymnoascus sp. VKM F-103]